MDPVTATASIALAGVSGGLSASQTLSAGKIARYESEVEAEALQTESAARETDRRERLANAIAQQNAASGASGTAFSGSPLSIIEADIAAADKAQERDVLGTRIGAIAARTRGKVQDAQAKGAAVSGLLQTGSKMAGLMP